MEYYNILNAQVRIRDKLNETQFIFMPDKGNKTLFTLKRILLSRTNNQISYAHHDSKLTKTNITYYHYSEIVL